MKERDLRNKIIFDYDGLKLGVVQSVKLKEGGGNEAEVAEVRLDRMVVSEWPELTRRAVPLDLSLVASVSPHTIKLSVTMDEFRKHLLAKDQQKAPPSDPAAPPGA